MSKFDKVWWHICEEHGWDWRNGTNEHWDELSEKEKDELEEAFVDDNYCLEQQLLESEYAAYMYD